MMDSVLEKEKHVCLLAGLEDGNTSCVSAIRYILNLSLALHSYSIFFEKK
jgi:hypothetical protein